MGGDLGIVVLLEFAALSVVVGLIVQFTVAAGTQMP